MDKYWVDKIERECPGEFLRTFSGLSNQNSQECSTSIGKKKGVVPVALAGKSKGVKEAVGTQYPKNGLLRLAARCPVVASHSRCPCTWDPRERDQIFPESPGKKHGGGTLIGQTCLLWPSVKQSLRAAVWSTLQAQC